MWKKIFLEISLQWNCINRWTFSYSDDPGKNNECKVQSVVSRVAADLWVGIRRWQGKDVLWIDSMNGNLSWMKPHMMGIWIWPQSLRVVSLNWRSSHRLSTKVMDEFVPSWISIVNDSYACEIWDKNFYFHWVLHLCIADHAGKQAGSENSIVDYAILQTVKINKGNLTNSQIGH